MGGGAAARVLTRLLMLAIVIGLFVMHGLPAQACPGGDGMPSPEVTTATTAEQMSGRLFAVDVIASHHRALPDALLAAACSDVAEHGSACVFTAPPRSAGALLALLVLVAAALLVAPVRSMLSGPRSPFSYRGPPRGGVELLNVLCVSRT